MNQALGKADKKTKLTKKDALRAYAAMWNTLDLSKLEPFLADDFRYVSQLSFADIESKQKFLEYITAILQTTGSTVWAEMGCLDEDFPSGPCVVVAHGGRRVGLVLAEVRNGKIKRLSWCIVPPPESARRTGEYPQ
jgi:hypothetical protein